MFNLLLSIKALRAVILLFLLGVLTQAMPAQAHDSLSMTSDTGDYVGGGEIRRYTPAEGTFTAGRPRKQHQNVFPYLRPLVASGLRRSQRCPCWRPAATPT